MTILCEDCKYREICEKHPHNPCLMEDNDEEGKSYESCQQRSRLVRKVRFVR